MINLKNLGITLRPRKFSEMIGNVTTIKAMTNRCDKDNNGDWLIPNYAIFSGASGSGKDTSALIFAKLLQCERPIKNSEGIYEPCCECNNCKHIENLEYTAVNISHYNAKEIGIDKAKEIIQEMNTHSMLAKHKIIIIGEAHLMSQDAKNELLTPLETLRPDTYLFLTTTDINKLIEKNNVNGKKTILSRLKKFPFYPIDYVTIMQYLKDTIIKYNLLDSIEKEYQIEFAKKGLILIARYAEGNLREAINTLGDILLNKTFSEKEIMDFLKISSDTQMLDFFMKIVKSDITIFSDVDAMQNLEEFFYQSRSTLLNAIRYKETGLLKWEWQKENFEQLKPFDIMNIYEKVYRNVSEGFYFNESTFIYYLLKYFKENEPRPRVRVRG